MHDCRNFVVDPKVKGTINIISARPVPRSMVYPTLLSALRLQGFAAVEGDGISGVICGRAIYTGALDFSAAQARADELGGD